MLHNDATSKEVIIEGTQDSGGATGGFDSEQRVIVDVVGGLELHRDVYAAIAIDGAHCNVLCAVAVERLWSEDDGGTVEEAKLGALPRAGAAWGGDVHA